MPLPTTSAHLSDIDQALLIEQYGGMVESQFVKKSMMRAFVSIRPVRGTDTITNNRVGKTSLQKVTPGVRPDATPTTFGKVQLTVDTIVLARSNQALLNTFQEHFDVRAELAEDHGKEIGKFFDNAFLIACVKGARQSAPTGLGGAIKAGKNVDLAGANDHLDPDKLADGIAEIVTLFKEEDIDADELVVFVAPREYRTLLDNNKLLDTDFSMGNGDFAKRVIKMIEGVPIVETNRIQQTEVTNHLLSNADNSNFYDVDATHAKAVAVIMHPRSLLSGETIPMTSDVYYMKSELQWFIDSYLSFGVTVNRPDLCGAVFKN